MKKIISLLFLLSLFCTSAKADQADLRKIENT